MATSADHGGDVGRPVWSSPDGPTLMAVINANQDSFSDPRRRTDVGELVADARVAVAEGAAVVDLGAQSAALGAELVPTDEQAARLLPLVEPLAADGVAVSVDTYDPVVAQAVLDAGAEIINDFSGRVDPATVAAVASAGGWYVLTHNPLGPRRRQTDPDFYDEVVDDVVADLTAGLEELDRLGVPGDRVVLDPGVDVAKTPAQTLALLRGRDRIRAAFDQTLLWAISRKDVLGAITGRPPRQRDAATLALVGALAHHPHTVLRLHDVAGAHDHLAVVATLVGQRELGSDLLDDRLRREAD